MKLTLGDLKRLQAAHGIPDDVLIVVDDRNDGLSDEPSVVYQPTWGDTGQLQIGAGFFPLRRGVKLWPVDRCYVKGCTAPARPRGEIRPGGDAGKTLVAACDEHGGMLDAQEQRRQEMHENRTIELPDTCMPVMQCSCCVCRGKHCLMGHPGHDHRYPVVSFYRLSDQAG